MGVAGRRWVQAGVVAAGVGAAMMTGTAVASATPDEDTGPAATSAERSPSAATPRARASRAATNPRRGSAASATAAAKPAAARSIPVPRSASSARRSVTVSAPSTPAPAPQVSAPVRADATAASVSTDPGPIRAAVLAAQAYIYGYPLLEYERVRATATSLNTITSLTSFANPDVDPIWKAIGGGKRPNVDTFYSVAELELSGGPVVLTIPDMGTRYFSFQLTDPYTNVTGYIGSRTTGSGPGSYAITWADGPSVDVPGAQVIEVPYASMLMLGRTLAGDEADQQSAIALMRQYALDPTGPTADEPAILPASNSGVDILNAISDAITKNPPPAQDAPILGQISAIGVGTGLQVADANLGLLSTLAVDLAVRATAALLPALAGFTQYMTAIQNAGWATPNMAIGDYGTDYVLRAGVAEIGLVANTPQEAMYSAGLLSGYLIPLSGIGSHVLHFAPGEAPPAEAFWSVTVYDADGNLVKNPENRYSVSNSRPDLVTRPDGSIDIIFSRTDPGDPTANWLPVPLGGFSAYLRMYVPEQAALDGAWVPPGIIRRSWFA